MIAILMPWFYVIAALPTYGLAAILKQPTRLTMATIGLICAVWHALLIAWWTTGTFFTFMQYTEPGLTIPLLLWGFSVAMRPLAGMAGGEDRDAVGTRLGLDLAMLTYVMLTILFLLGVQELTMVSASGVLAVIEAVLCTVLAIASVPPNEPEKVPGNVVSPVDELQELIDAGFTDDEILTYLGEGKPRPEANTAVHHR